MSKPITMVSLIIKQEIDIDQAMDICDFVNDALKYKLSHTLPDGVDQVMVVTLASSVRNMDNIPDTLKMVGGKMLDVMTDSPMLDVDYSKPQ